MHRNTRRAVFALICATVVVSAQAEAARARRKPGPPTVIEVVGVTIECREGEVVGIRDGAEVWKILHPSLMSCSPRVSKRQVTSPVECRGRLYYGTGCYVLEVDVEEGIVRRRLILPDMVYRLRAIANGVRITYGHSTKKRSVRFYRETTVFNPGGPEPPLQLTGSVLAALPPRSDAENLREHCPEEFRRRKLTEDEKRLKIEAAARQLEEQVARDPTNPFLKLKLADVRRELGDEEAAREIAAKALDLEGNPRILLLVVSACLEEKGYHDLAEKAFAVGYRTFLDAGHEPEQFMTLIGLMTHFGPVRKPVQEAIEKGDLDAAASVLERVWKLAPRCETVTMAFEGMALEFEKAGRAGEAAKWRERAEYATPSRFLGGIGGSFGRASQGSNIAGSGGLAAFLYGLYLVVKVAAARIRLRPKARATGEGADGDEVKRFLGPVPISRLEIAGFVAALVIAFVGVPIAVPGIRGISRAAAIEMGATNGSWGSPAAVNYWKEQAGSPEGDEHYAFALTQAGKREEAVRILEGLAGSAEAQNNLGVALRTLGREEEAKSAFERALAVRHDLPEALYNLGREASSVRVERAREYLPGKPVLAMPSQRSYEKLMARPFEEGGSPPGLGMAGPLSGSEAVRLPIAVVLNVVLLVFILAAVAYGLWRAKEPAAGRDDADWWLSLAIPGSSRKYAPWGAVLLATYAYFGFIAHASGKVPGALSVIDCIALADSTGSFGVGVPFMSGGRAALVWSARVLVWLIPIASAAGVLAFRFLGRRDERVEEPAPPFWWRVTRAAIFLALGVPLLVFSWGVAACTMPAVILILAGVASAAVAVLDHRREAGAPAAPA